MKTYRYIVIDNEKGKSYRYTSAVWNFTWIFAFVLGKITGLLLNLI